MSRCLVPFPVRLLAVLLVIGTAAASQLPARGAAEYWPADEWRSSTPESQGLSSAKLAEVLDFIGHEQIQIHSLLVVRHGWLVLEAYFFPCTRATLHDVCSCTKSVSSTLIGIAMDQGKIRSVKESISDLFPNRTLLNDSPAKRRITLQNILSMTSGMDYPLLGEPRLAPMRRAPDMVQAVLDLPMVAEPGTVFGYNSGGSHLLSAIVTLRTGMTAEDFARTNLFGPLGISTWSWPSTQGINHGWGDLRLRSADMARIGYLFLKKGRWAGRQVVSQRWVEEATRWRVGAGGTAGYGYQWWLQKEPDRFEALGRAGQRITVIPQLDLVMVMTGGGFEPKDVGDRMGAALRSDRAIPEDPSGLALLQRKIKEASAPPPAQPVPALPAAAREISGRRYVMEDNDMELRSIAFVFDGGNTAKLELLTSGEETRPLGLDGVYRISTAGSSAEQVAVRGAWTGEKTFEFIYNEFAAAQIIRAKATFDGNGLSLRLADPFDDLDVTIRGRVAK